MPAASAKKRTGTEISTHVPIAELQANSELGIAAVRHAPAASRPVLLRIVKPIASALPASAQEQALDAGTTAKRRSLWMFPLLVFLLSAGTTFSAIYIDALHTATGLSMPRFVRAMLPNPSLGLRVEYQGDHLLVTWNPHSSTVRAAVAGVLRIEDGGEKRDVRLDAPQIAVGSILYQPGSDDITFRLELYEAQGTTRVESVRVLAPRDTLQRSTPIGVKPERQPKPLSEISTPPAKPSAKTPAADIAVTALATNTAVPHMHLKSSDPQSTVKPGAPVPAHGYVPPVSTPPSATRTQSPAVISPDIMPDGKTLSLYTPARPLRQVMPNPALFRPAQILKPVQVTVRVTIDATGRVTQAELVPDQAALSSSLYSAALAAAREWLFEPATVGGVPAESQHSIVFAFQPPNR